MANDFTAMLAARTIQGIGGGGIILMNDILITDLVPLRLRGAYFGMIAGVWALGTVSGPVIGGVLAYKASWVCHSLNGHLTDGILCSAAISDQMFWVC
jgi:MFS family permease